MAVFPHSLAAGPQSVPALISVSLLAVAVTVVGGLGTSVAGAAEPIRLFNGRDLSGWNGKPELWAVNDGVILGNSPGLKENHFLVSDEEYGDFEFTFEVRLHDPAANSGVQFRSQRDPKSTEMIGYQADIGKDVWGGLYDESRRRKFLTTTDKAKVAAAIRDKDWNSYLIRAKGPNIRLVINGVETVNYTEADSEIPQKGRFGLQVHSGGPFRVEFRNLVLHPLP